MPAELVCFEERCRARYGITELIYNCPRCGGLLEAAYSKPESSAGRMESAVARAADAPTRPSIRAASGGIANSFRSWTIYSARGDPARRQHAAPGWPPGGGIRRAGPAGFQAPGLQSHRLVQGQRHDLRRRPGAAAGNDTRGLRLHRQHLGFHGGVCQRGRAAAGHLHPARQHLLSASWRRRWNTARGRFRWRRISIRFWRWSGSWPSGWASIC